MAEAATKRFSLSVEIWQLRLQVLIQLKSDNVTQCFEEAFKHVKSKVCAGFMYSHACVRWKTSDTYLKGFFFFLHSALTFPGCFLGLFHLHIAFRSTEELQVVCVWGILFQALNDLPAFLLFHFKLTTRSDERKQEADLFLFLPVL